MVPFIESGPITPFLPPEVLVEFIRVVPQPILVLEMEAEQ